MLRITVTENIARINSFYNSRQLERQNEALHAQNQRYVFLVIVIALLMDIIVAGVAVYYRFMRAEHRQLQANNYGIRTFQEAATFSDACQGCRLGSNVCLA